MPVVAVKPERELVGAMIGGWVGLGVGPLAQACLNEALGLSVGLGGVRPGAQMLDFEPAQRLGVAAGAQAGAVVGHDAVDLDAEASKEAQGIEEEAQAGASFFVRQDLRVGDARMVWRHQRSWFKPNGQPPESSHLEQDDF
jgi:hypothetical protein